MMSKLLRHAKSGTLPAVSIRWLHSRFNSVRWAYAGYTIVPLAPTGSLKLYRDSQLSTLIRYGDFERAERTFVERFLRPKDTFVDVGANVGLYTVLAAGFVGRDGRVISFEPCHRTYSRLVENIRRNRFQNVTCVHAALSDNSGTTRLYAGGHEMDAWNSLSRPAESHASATEEIATVTWDAYSAEHAIADRVTLMKIDVEGWEEAVLRGASRALSRPDAPVLQVEFCEENARSAGSSCVAIFDVLSRLGYELYEYESLENQMRLVDRKSANGNRNFYAVKDMACVMARLRGPNAAVDSSQQSTSRLQSV